MEAKLCAGIINFILQLNKKMEIKDEKYNKKYNVYKFTTFNKQQSNLFTE